MSTAAALLRARPPVHVHPTTPAPTPVPGALRDLPEVAGTRRALVLLELAQHGPCDAPTLARRCALDPGVVVAHLQDLAAAGFAVVAAGRWSAVSLVERERRRTVDGPRD